MRYQLFAALLILPLLSLTQPAAAHPANGIKHGPLKGCHTSKKSNEFHCHNGGPFDGRTWPSRDAALADLGGGKPSAAINPEPEAKRPASRYNRKKFEHWIHAHGGCLNTRQDLLIERSSTPVTFAPSKKGKCVVKEGRWEDFYFNETLEHARDVDIDHVIPLKHAWDAGADLWSAAQRRDFANDPENLVITNLKYNREKGAKTIMEWMPMNRAYACKYASRWFLIKKKYRLRISAQEVEYRELLKCPNAL
ncbi:MAG: HNH endonuclease [Proteobacteria bacterium]|nr:MAG: HNH endonuclease [Pseudomonadota bacterium]